MIVGKGKVYWAPVFYDIDGTEIYIKKKKQIKKLKKNKKIKSIDDLRESYEPSWLDKCRWIPESKGIIGFKSRPVLVMRVLDKKNKVKVVPIYTRRDKYEGDKYCYKIKDNVLDISREFNINKKLLKRTKRSIDIGKDDFNNIVDLYMLKICPKHR